jgi:hypothetical protein
MLGCCLHSYNDFLLMFTLRCGQADIVATVSSTVSTFHRKLTIAGVVVTAEKLIAGVMESMKIREKT